jgi:hypothetical protein
MEVGTNPPTGKFTQGNTFGKGRPKGLDKTRLIGKAISEEDFSQLLRLIYRRALGEDVAIDMAAAKLILDCIPVARSRSFIETKTLVNIKNLEDFDKAMKDTLTMVGKGEMSVEDGIESANLIEKRGINILHIENKKLKEALEQVNHC